MNQETKQCQNCKQKFTIEPDDFAFYEKIDVPPPTLCPDCRYQRRIANRNEWNFYKRKCDMCGKDMVSIYNPLYPGPVYCQKCWWSDKWDPFEYGRDIDFSKPFFEQFFEFRYKVPRVALANHNSINSEYSNQSEENKNCYMVVAGSRSEECMYGNWNQGSKNCVDCWAVKDCEIMYESLNCRKCYRCLFVENSLETTDSYFCMDCRGCSNCFGCIGLRNKSYCWFNEQLSRKEYEQRLSAIRWTLQTIADFREKLQELLFRVPVKYYHGSRNINSVGDYIGGNKNTNMAFNCRLSENLRYGQDAWEARDCLDMTETLDNELDYEMEGAGWGSHCIVSAKSWYNNDTLYSELNFSCNNIFGCVSLRTKSYCILNKQYTEAEYKNLKKKLIEHMRSTDEWGEFFPIETSPFPYNDSLAQDYFPLTKEHTIARGWKWYDSDLRDYQVTLPHNELPTTIEEISDDILKKVISCSTQDSESEKQKHLRCATAFRLHPAELAFYRRLKLPIPHLCFPCRLQNRLARRNPRKLWHRQCTCAGVKSESKVYKNTAEHFHGADHCPNEFETSYAPDRKEIVYCEQCYQAEIA
ncbi:MAG TPA: hypothetical protein ENH86_02075 [Candidatus Jorgensenbacteria bacterium]|nr:hypothetical protein [Candidatus Jorgensenbacteria bacterium]